MVGGIEPAPLEEELAAAAAVKQGAIFVLENANLVGDSGCALEQLLCGTHSAPCRHQGHQAPAEPADAPAHRPPTRAPPALRVIT